MTNKILTRNSDYIVSVVIWPKFGNCNIVAVIWEKLNFIKILPENQFFWELVLDQNSKRYGCNRYVLKILQQCGMKPQSFES